MLRWMYGLTRLEKIRNEVTRERVGVAPLEEKLRETRLRWFGHVKRSVNAPVKRCEAINILHFKGGRGRLKRSWDEVIRKDMKLIGLTEDMTQDRNLWRSRIKIVDYR